MKSESGSVDELIVGSISDTDQMTGFQENNQTTVSLNPRQLQILEASVTGNAQKLIATLKNGGYTTVIDQVSVQIVINKTER